MAKVDRHEECTWDLVAFGAACRILKLGECPVLYQQGRHCRVTALASYEEWSGPVNWQLRIHRCAPCEQLVDYRSMPSVCCEVDWVSAIASSCVGRNSLS
eukprot:6538515-Prymnesium_polylepis.1